MDGSGRGCFDLDYSGIVVGEGLLLLWCEVSRSVSLSSCFSPGFTDRFVADAKTCKRIFINELINKL